MIEKKFLKDCLELFFESQGLNIGELEKLIDEILNQRFERKNIKRELSVEESWKIFNNAVVKLEQPDQNKIKRILKLDKFNWFEIKFFNIIERILNGSFLVEDDEYSIRKLILKNNGKYSTHKISVNTYNDVNKCEDNVIVDEDKGIFILADGHASGRAPREWSACVLISRFVYDFLKKNIDKKEPRELLEEAVRHAHNEFKNLKNHLKEGGFYHFLRQSQGYDKFGRTTLDIGLIRDNKLHYLRIGDGILKIITKNGNIFTPYDEEHGIGFLEKAERESDAERKEELLQKAEKHLFNQTLRVNEAFGARGSWDDLPTYEYRSVPLDKVKRIVMATDGMQYLSSKRIKEIVFDEKDLEKAIKQLIIEARTNPDERIVEMIRNREEGVLKEDINQDDISIILIDVEKLREIKRADYIKESEGQRGLKKENEDLNKKVAQLIEENKLLKKSQDDLKKRYEQQIIQLREEKNNLQTAVEKLKERLKIYEKQMAQYENALDNLKKQLNVYRNRFIKRQPIEDRVKNKEDIEIILSDFDLLSNFEATRQELESKSVELRRKYGEYIIKYQVHFHGRIIKEGKCTFGEFLSKEYEKIKKIYSNFEDAKLKKEYLKNWCEKQLLHVDDWKRIARNKGENYLKEILSYERYLKSTIKILSRDD